MERILDRRTGRTVIVPMDHGITVGPIKGLIDLREAVNRVAEDEAEMLADLGQVARTCDHWGMPLLAMMYPRGPGVSSEHNVEHVTHAARIGDELGADIICTRGHSRRSQDGD